MWKAWQQLPPADRHFIQTAPWKKLTVGVRLANWQPAGTTCPICGLLETTQHALTACKYFSVAAHVASQCMGPATTDQRPETDPTAILWDQPELSLTTPLGITLWSAVRAAWSHRCMIKMNVRVVRPSWDQFLTLWIKVLRGWEEHPTPTLPAIEISLLVHALQSMQDHTVLQHPRVAVSTTRSPPKLYVPARKRKKKFENAEALAAQYKATIQTYREQGWDIIHHDGSLEKHPEVGWMGGYGVFFGDQRDTAEYIPLGEDQTNNRGEICGRPSVVCRGTGKGVNH